MKKESNVTLIHLSMCNGDLMHDPCGLAVDEFYRLWRIVEPKAVGERLFFCRKCYSKK